MQRLHQRPRRPALRPRLARPRVEPLEDRLPPGDWVLSQLVGTALFGPAPAATPAGPAPREPALTRGSLPRPEGAPARQEVRLTTSTEAAALMPPAPRAAAAERGPDASLDQLLTSNARPAPQGLQLVTPAAAAAVPAAAAKLAAALEGRLGNPGPAPEAPPRRPGTDVALPPNAPPGSGPGGGRGEDADGIFQVESTSPPVDSVVPIPLATFQVRFNLPVDPTSVQPDDLRLDPGSASDVRMVDDRTAEFTLTGVTHEGALTAVLPAGAVADMLGNPNLAFAGTYTLDVEVAEFPTPLQARPVPGSLVYDGSTDGILAPADDWDVFYYLAAPHQTLAHVVTPAPGLHPYAELYAFVGDEVVLLGSATAPAAGQPAVLGPVRTPAVEPLFYAVVVAGAGGTGAYTLSVVLNAAPEAELHGNGSNNTVAKAQDLDPAFQTLPGGGSRAAALGQTDFSAGMLPEEFEPNNTRQTANLAAANFVSDTSALYHLGLKGEVTPQGDLDYFRIGQLNAGDVITISMSGQPSNRGTIGDSWIDLYRGPPNAPVLVTSNDDGGPGLDSLLYRFTVTQTDTYYVNARGFSNSYVGFYDVGVWLEDVGAPPLTGGTVTREAEPNNSAALATDAADSWRRVQWLARTDGQVTSAADTDFFEYHLTAGDLITVRLRAGAGTVDLQAALLNSAGTVLARETGDSQGPDRDSPLYGFLIPATGSYYLQVAGQGTGGYTADVWLSTNTPPPEPIIAWDYYRFTVGQDESVTVGLKGLADPNVRLSIVDADDNVLATGTPSANLDSVIGNFTAPAGTYYVRVDGRLFKDYNLVVTRGLDFDTEANDRTPQPLAAGYQADGFQWVLGHAGVGASADEDRYRVTVAAGQTLLLLSQTPGDQGGVPGNTFDPILRVYAPGNVLVALDDNSLDGRNALLTYTAPVDGDYVLEIASTPAAGTRGAYLLGVTVLDGYGGGPWGGAVLAALTGAGRPAPHVPATSAAQPVSAWAARPEFGATPARADVDGFFAAAARGRAKSSGPADRLFPGWEG